jgi:hypothetical protein
MKTAQTSTDRGSVGRGQVVGVKVSFTQNHLSNIRLS